MEIMKSQFKARPCRGRDMARLTAILVLALTLLSACMTTSQAEERMVAEFLGMPMDDFVLDYGPPYSQYRFEDGRTVYEWTDDRRLSFAAPSTTTTSNGTTVTEYDRVSLDLECRLRIATDASGRIEQIRIIRDSIGYLTISRCAEIFFPDEQTGEAQSTGDTTG